ncbi:site-specific integrase [Chryseobacterium sp. 'Rf worker isolate 10']|uniref:site-specific integrase n=1 Tax=Chryseobacterium sp. 'Rf worker isolate 10' TaxID=2887348 RepID=UPI003D6F7D5C
MEESIYTLHTSLKKYINENGDSSSMLKRFSTEFNNLIKYMESKSLTNYCEEIGDSYLKYRDSIISIKAKQNYRNDRRYIILLNGMLKKEWVYKYQGRNYDIPFPGDLGVFFMNFLNNYCHEKGLAIGTKKNYYRCLYTFCERLQIDNIISLKDVTSNLILSFLSSQNSMANEYAIIFRAILKKLYEEKIVDYHASHILDQFKKKRFKKLPSYYTPIEISQLEANIDRATAVGKRDYAMILLATRLGLRSSDIRYLNFSNINWNENIIRLEQFKTKKIIELPLLIDIGEAIIDYIKHGRPKSNISYIFLRASGPYNALSDGAFYTAIKKYFKIAHIDFKNKKAGSHSLRHSLATNMLNKGTSLLIISSSLGHSNITSTTDYLNLNIEKLLLCSLDVPIVDKEFYSQINYCYE